MTDAQFTTFKTDVTVTRINFSYGGKTFSQWLSESNFAKIAEFYNTNTNPNVNIYKPNIPVSEIAPQIVISEFVSLSLQVQNGYFVLTQGDYLDATDANTRASFQNIFGPGTTTRANLNSLSLKVATNFENLFTTSQVSTAFGVTVSAEDVQRCTR